MENLKINQEVHEVENSKLIKKIVFEKEINEVEKKLYAKDTVIEEALTKLSRADIVLQHWTQEYSYSKKPDPMAAINWWNGTDQSVEAKQAANWFWDYNYIFEFIEIVFDYIMESKKILEGGLK